MGTGITQSKILVFDLHNANRVSINYDFLWFSILKGGTVQRRQLLTNLFKFRIYAIH